MYKRPKASYFFVVALVLSNCSPVGQNDVSPSDLKEYLSVQTQPEEIAEAGIEQILEGDYLAASAKFNAALKLSPSNSGIHFLNGLAYHLASSDGDESKRALAQQGYELAIQFDKSNWIVRYQLGLLHLEARDFESAKEQFAEAILLKGNNPDLLYQMGFTSYYTQDLQMASAVFNQLLEVEPESVRGREGLAMVSAANNQPEQAGSLVADLQSNSSVGGDRVQSLQGRLDDWDRFHSRSPDSIKRDAPQVRQTVTNPEYDLEQTSPAFEPRNETLDMIVLDTVFISTEEVISSSRGTNLLDGLSVQFGDKSLGTSAFSRARDNSSGTRTTTTSSYISIPAINYSLNIANSFGNRNEILARPSLVARSGAKSTFFAGIELDAGVAPAEGEAFSLSKQVGVSLDITPEIREDGRIELSIIASRTFLKTPSGVIEFDFAVELSKTEVSANVIVNEGDTLILSGLSEKEISSTRDGTPGLQEIPGLQYLFSNREDYKLQKSVLILITARPADYIYRNPSYNSGANPQSGASEAMVELRAKYLDWFKPYPNTASVFEFMQGNALYREFRTGDVKMEQWQGSQALAERLREARAFLYY